MKHMLPYRDLLDWKTIDLLFAKQTVWYENIFGLMNQVTYPLKVLSINVNELTKDEIRDLYAMASTIESLKLEYTKRLEVFFLKNIYSCVFFKLFYI